MSILHITEYSLMASDRVTQGVPAPQEPANRCQQMPIGSEAAQSKPFLPNTTFVRLFAKAPCRVYFGPRWIEGSCDPIPAHAEVFRGVNAGDSVFVIEDSE